MSSREKSVPKTWPSPSAAAHDGVMGKSARASLRELRLAPGRVVKVTPVFDTYWRFATLRQNLFMSRVQGLPLGFTLERYARVLDRMMERGQTVYSAAYIMPSPPFGSARKHHNHLQLLERMMRDGTAGRVAAARSLRDVFEILRGYPSLGDFLAFQFTIDLNYGSMIDFSEMEFVVAGPSFAARNTSAGLNFAKPCADRK